jgi:beta-lactamase class A
LWCEAAAGACSSWERQIQSADQARPFSVTWILSSGGFASGSESLHLRTYNRVLRFSHSDRVTSMSSSIPKVVLAILFFAGVVSAQVVGSSSSARSASPDLAALRAKLEQIRGGFPGVMSVYMKNLSTGEELVLDSDKVMETFSIIKLAIAAELVHQAGTGKLSLTDRVSLTAGNRRLPSGVLYALDPGLTPTLKDLLTLMIIISDNEATDALADKLGRDQITAYMRTLGLEKTTIQFSDLDWDRHWLGSLDPKYLNASGDQTIDFPFGKYSEQQVQDAFGRTIYDAGIYFGHSTTREIGRLLEMMVNGKLVSKDASALILGIMEKQQVNDRFPRYLKNVRIAHKTGDGQPFIANDAGVLWVNNQPIVLVVFTGHHRGATATLHDTIARIAALVVQQYGGEVNLPEAQH